MHPVRFHLWVLEALGAVIACAGCAGQQGPQTFPVTGIVTLNGAPAADITVTFVPDGVGISAVGVTNASGTYTLTTRTSGDGALPGRYQVSLAKYEGGMTTAAEPGKVNPNYDVSNEYAAGYDESAAGSAPPSKNLLPEKFADPGTSGFSADVVAGPNTYNFDVKK